MTHSPLLWRLIDTGPLDGPANMAHDEALLSCLDAGGCRPVLRLYGWNPPTLSVGRYQDAGAALKLDLCEREGVPVVRRMTGGGIIFHGDEITYSVICSPHHLGDAVGVKDGFRTLCAFLLKTYQRLGHEASFARDVTDQTAHLGERTAFCFAGKEEYDILIGGRKIGGNAQRRLKGAILQHGSIPIKSRVREGLSYLTNLAPGAENAISLCELGVMPGLHELKQVLMESFEEALGGKLVPDTLTEEEGVVAARLKETKYSRSAWNLHGEVTS